MASVNYQLFLSSPATLAGLYMVYLDGSQRHQGSIKCVIDYEDYINDNFTLTSVFFVRLEPKYIELDQNEFLVTTYISNKSGKKYTLLNELILNASNLIKCSIEYGGPFALIKLCCVCWSPANIICNKCKNTYYCTQHCGREHICKLREKVSEMCKVLFVKNGRTFSKYLMPSKKLIYKIN